MEAMKRIAGVGGARFICRVLLFAALACAVGGGVRGEDSADVRARHGPQPGHGGAAGNTTGAVLGLHAAISASARLGRLGRRLSRWRGRRVQ